MSHKKEEIKVLSFDVGIKNLSYCILTKNNEKYKIHNWGIINLTEDIIKEKNETGNDDPSPHGISVYQFHCYLFCS